MDQDGQWVEADLLALKRGPDRGERRNLFWGSVDQLLSSATNLALAIMAGRGLGPAGLGVIAIAFTAYLLLLGFQRALVSDPVVVASARSTGALPPRELAEAGLTVVLVAAVLASAFLLVLGLSLSGTIGRALLLLAPWMTPLLVQDYWRALLFRDRRGRGAATNDATWALVMTLMLVVLWTHRSDGTAIAAWAMGATAGAGLGFLQTGLRASKPQQAWLAWVSHCWPLGRWLGLDSVVYVAGAQGSMFIVAALISRSDLEKLRAIQSLFAPLSILGPAVALPGLPALVRAHGGARRTPRNLAIRLGLLLLTASLAYVLAAGFEARPLLKFVFGSRFSRFSTLALAVGLGQVFAAWAIGSSLLLKSQRKGRKLLIARAVGSVASITSTAVLAIQFGVVGAAWGMTIGLIVWSLTVSILGLVRPGRRAEGALDNRPVLTRVDGTGYE